MCVFSRKFAQRIFLGTKYFSFQNSNEFCACAARSHIYEIWGKNDDCRNKHNRMNKNEKINGKIIDIDD